MSKLAVTQIETADTVTPLTITTGNNTSGSIKVESANSDIVLTGNATLNGNTVFNGNITGLQSGIELTNPIITGAINEDIFTITDGAAVDLDPTNGTIQVWTLGASRTPTATNFANGQSITLMINDGSAYAITWPTMTWVNNGGSAPTLATSGYTVVALWKVSTTLYGALVGDGS